MKQQPKYGMRTAVLAALLLVAVGWTGCTKDRIGDNGSGGGATAEPVPVTLTLNAEPMQSPGAEAQSAANSLYAADSATATGGAAGVNTGAASGAPSRRVVASERSGGMLVELVEEPDSPATRAVNETEVANAWVFQYDGTATDSRLVAKTYYTSLSTVMLIPGTAQRVVVVVNTFDAAFGNDQTVGSTTYQALFDKAKTITDEAGLMTNNCNNMPMSGTWTGDIVPKQRITLNVVRNVTRVVVRLKNFGVTATKWTIQVFNVPNQSYWLPDRGDAIFPASPTMINYQEQEIPAPSATVFGEYSWHVPTNCRGTVAGTVPKTRKTKAPAQATYVKISAQINTETSVESAVTNYYIHLGADFAADYNVRPNYRYTYEVTLLTDPDLTDSRVEFVPGSNYVGMFGGELAETYPGSGVWQFTKALYIETNMRYDYHKWAIGTGDHSSLAGKMVPGYQTDGKGNTWRLNKAPGGGSLTDFAAANSCFKYNRRWESITATTSSDYNWFLPAKNQLMGIWVSKNGFDSSNHYSTNWSSTEESYGYSWYVDLDNGYTDNCNMTEQNKSRRCVMELTLP